VINPSLKAVDVNEKTCCISGKEKLLTRLKEISLEEKVATSDETLIALVEASGGDMRKAITTLQSCSRLKDADEQVTPEDVKEVTGVRLKNSA